MASSDVASGAAAIHALRPSVPEGMSPASDSRCASSAGSSASTRVWSAASSSGEEAYSIAMTVLDWLETQLSLIAQIGEKNYLSQQIG